jgi:hypothetical protein
MLAAAFVVGWIVRGGGPRREASDEAVQPSRDEIVARPDPLPERLDGHRETTPGRPDSDELERRSAQAIDRALRAADAAVERRVGAGAHGDPVEEAAFEVFAVELTELERLERELSQELGERHPLTIELGRATGSLVALENDLSEGAETAPPLAAEPALRT